MRAFSLKKVATGAFFCASLLIAEDLLSVEACIPATNQNDQEEDTFAVLSCINGKGRTELLPGKPGYLIGGEGLSFVGDSNTVITSHASGRGTLTAMENMRKPILVADGVDYVIEDIDLNGQKVLRDVRWIGKTEDTCPPNMIVRGLRPTIRKNLCRESPAGTCIGLDATEARVYQNEFKDNGRQVGEFPYVADWPFYYLSDGLTIPFCWKCLIWRNYFFETTDFAIIVGVIPETVIQENEIYQRAKFAIGGISSGNMLTNRRHPVTGEKLDGNNATAIFYRNMIDCGRGRCASGISAGSHPFAMGNPADVDVEHGGNFIENTIIGAQINIWVDGAKKVELINNNPKDPYGDSAFFNLCRVSANLVMAHTEMVPPPDALRMIIHTTGCQPW